MYRLLLGDSVLSCKELSTSWSAHELPDTDTLVQFSNGPEGFLVGMDHLKSLGIRRQVRFEATESGVECHQGSSFEYK